MHDSLRTLFIRAALATDAQVPLTELLNTRSVERFYDALPAKTRQRLGGHSLSCLSKDNEVLRRELTWLRGCGARFLTPLCDDWPESAQRVGLLRVRGVLAGGASCAIVGTRKCSREGLHRTRELARLLAHAHYTVVSGGALGVDIEALRAAHGSGAPTITVLGSGLMHPSPRRHSKFYSTMLARGAMVSSFDSSLRPCRWTFAKRNQWISELADMCVVTEADAQSGALMAARSALKQGKQVFARESFRGERHLSGCRLLLTEGAKPLSVLVRTLLEQQGNWQKQIELEPAQFAILRALSFGSMLLEQLMQNDHLPYTKVRRALSKLAACGLVQRDEQGFWYRSGLPVGRTQYWWRSSSLCRLV